VINRNDAEINKKYGTFLIAELINLFPKQAAPNSKPKLPRAYYLPEYSLQ
jgi:hypothetical protein